MLTTFPHLTVRLQTVAQFIQQGGHGGMADRVTLLVQLGGQLARALAGPQQRTHRIAAGRSFDQSPQVFLQPPIRCTQRPTPSALPADPRAFQFARQSRHLPLNLTDSLTNRVPRQPGSACHRRHTSTAQGQGFTCCPMPSQFFIHHRAKPIVFGLQSRYHDRTSVCNGILASQH